VLDLSAHGFVTCMAAAGRSHVGSYAPRARRRPAFSAQLQAWAADPDRRCPYCGEREPQGGAEHVLSVALGNWFWVLPPNVVCARCNNQVLSRLDSALLRHPLVAVIRVLAGITGRHGQSARVGASNMRLRRNDDGSLHIEADTPRDVSRDEDTITMRPRWQNFGVPQRRLMARAVLKLALGTIWLARGPDETSLAVYDHVRDAIQGRGEVPLHYGFGNSRLPGHALQIMAISHRAHPGLRASLDYFGVELWAETQGYREQADDDFLEREIDVEFAQPADA
jgi:hypothetical protein